MREDAHFKGEVAKALEQHERRLDAHAKVTKDVCDEMTAVRDQVGDLRETSGGLSVIKGLVVALASSALTAVFLRVLLPLLGGTAQ